MNQLLPYALTALGVAAVIGGLVWAGRRVRRRGSGGAVAAALAAHDELWYPTAHQSHFELRLDEERKVDTPTPDELKGRKAGRR
ncbi:hypothetical protein AB0I28_29260 [Phytomonospora sp. NPDC050363]|uniref:hypothetical protein n=1 Tax=Phytomonospora sp. NPDC050363 TaxID=3155642 RepID=UPI0033DAD751